MTTKRLERPQALTMSVDDILRGFRDGEIGIPRFQRPFRWKVDDVVELFDSIYRGYPIGSLLFWESRRTDVPSVAFGLTAQPAHASRGLLVVDGQQRLASLAASLLGPDRNDVAQYGWGDADKFRILFDLTQRTFRSYRPADLMPPDAIAISDVAETSRYLAWLRSRPSLAPELVVAADEMVSALRDYRIPVYIVRTADEKLVRAIFERLNTGGRPLTANDVFHALHVPAEPQARVLTDLGLHVSRLGFGEVDERWLLKIVGAILDVDVTRKLARSISDRDSARVEDALRRTGAAMERVVTFLREDARLPHVALLPYRFPLVPLAKFFDLVPDPKAGTRRALSAWLWRSAVSGEHRRSDAIVIRKALRDVKADEDETTRRLLDGADEPKLANYLLPRHKFGWASAKIVCNVLASLGPADVFSGAPVDAATLLETHHERAFQQLLTSRAGTSPETRTLWTTAANRLIHPPAESGRLLGALVEWARSAQRRGDSPLSPADAAWARADALLTGHAIDEPARRALLAEDHDGFLRARAEFLIQRAKAYLSERCHTDARRGDQPATDTSMRGHA